MSWSQVHVHNKVINMILSQRIDFHRVISEVPIDV